MLVKTDKKYISYCGLYCRDCFIIKGDISNYARKLRVNLDKVNFGRYAKILSDMVGEVKGLSNYDIFYDVLLLLGNSMVCNKICKKGGGTSTCKIRKCCIAKSYDGCWECKIFENCEILGWLRPLNGDGNIRNLRVIKEKGANYFIYDKSKFAQ